MEDFYFKGQRDYLNGATIFDYIVNNFFEIGAPPKDIDFYINRMTKMNVEIFTTADRTENLKQIIGEFNSDKGKLLICEGDEEINQREPYDEKKIEELSIIADNSITIPEELVGFSAIEKIISGYKILLLSIFGKSHGKFIFARLLLNAIPKGGISIAHDRIISKRYFQGRIEDKAGKIGTVFFGVHNS